MVLYRIKYSCLSLSEPIPGLSMRVSGTFHSFQKSLRAMNLVSMFIMWFLVCADFIRAVSVTTVTAALGSTVALPCTLKQEFTQTSVIRWHVGKHFMFERSSDGTDTGSGYEGRVDVPEDELRKGNCSLVLKRVTLDDESSYKSFVMEHVDSANSEPQKEITRVKLTVAPQVVSAPVGSTVLLPCEWRDHFLDGPHIEWYIDSEIVFERKGKESFPGEGYEARVDVPEDELMKGNCSLVLKNFTVTDAGVYRSAMLVNPEEKSVLIQKIQLLVSEKSDERKDGASGAENSYHQWIPSVLGTVCVIVLAPGLFFILRKFWNHRRQQRTPRM